MKKKLSFALTIALIATLVIATPAFAAYDTVTGTLLDSMTQSPWTHGATITVHDCGNWSTLGTTSTIDANGTFTVTSLSAPTDPPGYLCIEIVFNDPPGPNPAPDTKWDVTQSGSGQSGTYNIGNIYTDTGPNAVTLADTSAGSPNVWLPVALAAVAVVAVGGAVLLLRRRRVA
jgi:hypothetical protein